MSASIDPRTRWMALFRRKRSDDEERDINPYSLQQYIHDYFSYAGNTYPIFSLNQPQDGNEGAAGGFEWFVRSAFRSSGIVFACMAARLAVFSDVRFVFRNVERGVPGDFSAPIDGRNPASGGLSLLRKPWFGATTGDLLARMIQDVDLAGNAFIARRAGQLVRLRPDWVTIVASSPPETSIWHPDAQLEGYVYKPGGEESDEAPIRFLREEVAHFAPTPDPLLRFRGITWLEPVLQEVMGDQAASKHTEAFFRNGATVNLVLQYTPGISNETFQAAVRAFKEQHEGPENAFKTLHVMNATPTPIGSNLQDADLTQIRGSIESRVAAASGVPSVVVGFSEGQRGSALNAGNYQQAKRNFADKTIRPLWRSVCGSLETIIPPPSGQELWFNDADVAFLREDQTDLANIRQIDATTINTLVTAGFSPQSATDAVTSNDLHKLVHTGLVSVQLNPPGKQPAVPAPAEPKALAPVKPVPAVQATNGKRDEITRKDVLMLAEAVANHHPTINVNVPRGDAPRYQRRLERDEDGFIINVIDEVAEEDDDLG